MIHILEENGPYLNWLWHCLQMSINYFLRTLVPNADPCKQPPHWCSFPVSKHCFCGFLGGLFYCSEWGNYPKHCFVCTLWRFISLSQAHSSSSSFCSIPLLLLVGCFSCFPQIWEWSPAWIHAAFQVEILPLPLWALWVQCWRNGREKNSVILSLLIVQDGSNKIPKTYGKATWEYSNLKISPIPRTNALCSKAGRVLIQRSVPYEGGLAAWTAISVEHLEKGWTGRQKSLDDTVYEEIT